MALLSSLSNRIFLASAALTVVCMGIAAYLVNARVTEAADLEAQRELAQTGTLVDQQRATLSVLFGEIARVVADLPKLQAAVFTDDPPTVQPLAEEYQNQIHSDLFLVTNRSGKLLASIESQGGTETDAMSLTSVRDALAGHESAMFRPHPHGIMQVVSVPVTAGGQPGDVLGSLSVGFLLDDDLAQRMKAMTGSEISFAADGRVVASSLPAAYRTALDPILKSQTSATVRVAQDEYVTLLRPLASTAHSSLLEDAARPPREPQLGAGPAPQVLILRSRTDRLRFLRPIQFSLGVIALGFVLLAIGISYALARTITRPLATITATMRDMSATGELTRKIAWPVGRWEDEDARLLASTFNALTDSVTRFQRDAAQRERLSALGRLSTVVAHEVRNPLMIIKASLQPLRNAAGASEEAREAVADIDEEVGRLNRIVTEVLDFARPIRFDLAPTDINEVCQASATAVTVAKPDPAIRLTLHPALPHIVTDAERLRSALVNLLVNARSAVEARSADDEQVVPGSPLIELISEPAAGGRVSIRVRDRGAGIAAEDLPRVFEPYFTTRRAGTGLGLAITRNIVDGLGGTIAVTSARGVGTEVHIELPGQRSGMQEG